MTFADHLRAHQDAHNGGGEMPISYGSVCSGIEAASVAWHHLGWIPRWFAEIEPFPSAVLAHHWPEVSNLGDFTAIRDKIAEGAVEAPDVLVGGTPCQAFSVAGLRQSLDDKRGQLTLEFVRLTDAIDSARSLGGKRPVTVVWENVPGVLNTPDNAFGCFLAGLVGEDDPLVPPGGRWTNAGYVRGPKRTVAWRILDAQYFGVAQRRRRVFVVASAGGIRPEQVLFELEGVRRDSPPSRQAGQGIARVAGTLTSNRGGFDRPAGNASELDSCIPVAQAFGGNNTSGPIDVSTTLNACPSASGHLDFESETFIAEPQAWAIQERAAHPNLNAGPGGKGYQEGVAYTLEARYHVQACAVTGDVFHTLRAEGADASEDGTRRGSGAIAVGFNARQDPDSWVGRTGPLDTDGGTQAVAVALRGREGGATIEVGDDVGFTLRVSQGGGDKPHVMAPVAFQSKQSASAQAPSFDSISPTLDVTKAGGMAALVGMQVRRLTPTEAERLQGFLDGHTLIPWRGKGAGECPDGPRYKALGNSMAVPVMRWIGARIARQLEAQA